MSVIVIRQILNLAVKTLANENYLKKYTKRKILKIDFILSPKKSKEYQYLTLILLSK